MAKEMIKEVKKITHKLTTEGTLKIVDGVITIDVPDEGIKQLTDLVKNFDGEYIKFAIQTDEQEDVE